MTQAQSTLQQILSGAAWVSLYSGLYRFVTLLIAVFAARLLDVTGYGQVAILQSTAALFIMFATLGMGTVATKLIAEAEHRYLKSIYLVNFAFCLASSIALFAGAGWIAEQVYQDISLQNSIAYLALYTFLCGMSQVQTGVLAGREAYPLIAKINLMVGLLALPLVYFSIAKWQVQGWLISLILLELLKVVLLHIFIHTQFGGSKGQVTQENLKAVLKLALPIAVSGFFVLPVNWYVTRELLLASGYLEVALLNISEQWIAILTFFPIAIGNALLPMLAKQGQAENKRNMSNLALKINALVALAAGVPTLLLGDWVLSLYGDEYIQHSYLFFWLLPLVVVLALTNQLNNRVIADSNANAMMYSNLVWLLVCLPLSVLLLDLALGLVAVLLARLAAYAAKLMFLFMVIRKGES